MRKFRNSLAVLKCVKIREFYEFFKIRKMRILKLWLLLHAVHIIQMLELLWLNQSVAFITCHLLLTNCKTILLSDPRRCYRRAVQCLDSSG